MSGGLQGRHGCNMSYRSCTHVLLSLPLPPWLPQLPPPTPACAAHKDWLLNAALQQLSLMQPVKPGQSDMLEMRNPDNFAGPAGPENPNLALAVQQRAHIVAAAVAL